VGRFEVPEYDGRYQDDPGAVHPFWPPRFGGNRCVACHGLRENDRHATGAGGFPLTMRVRNELGWVPEPMLVCPVCGSLHIYQAVAPGGRGTGPGGRWRVGDPGGACIVECGECGHKVEEAW
jgi:hypothetical protein